MTYWAPAASGSIGAGFPVANLKPAGSGTGGGGGGVYANKYWWDVVWSPLLEIFCAVGSGPFNGDGYDDIAVCITSPDGITWTERTVPSGTYFSITWSPFRNLFVAAKYGLNGEVITSPDGITWTTRTGLNSFTKWVAWSEDLSLFLSAGGTSGNSTDTSPDGVTWTSRGPHSLSTPYGLLGDAHGTGFVIGSDSSEPLWYTADGITIVDSDATGVGPTFYSALAFMGNVNQNIALPNNYANQAGTSKEGYLAVAGDTWLTMATLPHNGWIDACYGGGYCLAVSDAGPGVGFQSKSIGWSIDGNNWQAIAAPIDDYLLSCAYSPTLGYFVIMGYGFSIYGNPV